MNKFETPALTVEELSAALYAANEELRKTNEELKEKSEKLISADRARTEMFANISHDLRSPITAIKSSVEYLLSIDDPSKDEVREYLKLMGSRISILEDFINDIFLLATLESKAVSLKPEELDIVAFLEEFYCECEVNPKYDKRSLSLDINDYTPVMANIDTKQFLRVLDNLVSNALKYSADGDSISLGLEYIAGEPHNGGAQISGTDAPDGNATAVAINGNEMPGMVEITVSDTGIGIKPEDVEHIFDRSFMANRARTPDAKTGFGLGLNITREIVLLHGGSIRCESAFGYGTTFTISLPAKKE